MSEIKTFQYCNGNFLHFLKRSVWYGAFEDCETGFKGDSSPCLTVLFFVLLFAVSRLRAKLPRHRLEGSGGIQASAMWIHVDSDVEGWRRLTIAPSPD